MTPVPSALRWLLVSTMISELLLVGIPLLLILYYQHHASPKTRYFWLGVGLSLFTAIKFLFLIGHTPIPEPFYSITIFIAIEGAVRWFVHKETHHLAPPSNWIFFIIGYLFMKGVALGLVNFFAFMTSLTYFTQTHLVPPNLFIYMVSHSLLQFSYLTLLFLFFLIRTRWKYEIILIPVHILFLTLSYFLLAPTTSESTRLFFALILIGSSLISCPLVIKLIPIKLARNEHH
ncbi:MAG: hypothetical protein AABZ14_01765 [Candidatus Margulisiibacteriota bacterium]